MIKKLFSITILLLSVLFSVEANNYNNLLYVAIDKIGIDFNVPRYIKNYLKKGANSNAEFDGKTLVMYALDKTSAGRDRTRALNKLLSAKRYNPESPFDINYVGDNGMTALTYAGALGDFSMIDLLIKRGANPAKKDAYGMTYQDYLEESRKYDKYRGGYRDLQKIREARKQELGKEKLEQELEKELSNFTELPSKEEIEEGEWEMIEND